MLHRLILTFALAFLLGFSQQSALLHEISHLADINPLSEQQDQAPQHAANCDHCLSFNHFAGSIPSSYDFSFGAIANNEPALFVTLDNHLHPHHAYAARAPPSLI